MEVKEYMDCFQKIKVQACNHIKCHLSLTIRNFQKDFNNIKTKEINKLK